MESKLFATCDCLHKLCRKDGQEMIEVTALLRTTITKLHARYVFLLVEHSEDELYLHCINRSTQFSGTDEGLIYGTKFGSIKIAIIGV
jgi:hypothetical protein